LTIIVFRNHVSARVQTAPRFEGYIIITTSHPDPRPATVAIPQRLSETHLEIDAESMGMAIELTKWFRRESKRVYLISNQARQSDEEEKVYEYLAIHPETTVRDLQRNLLRGKSSDYVEEIIKRLVKKGRVTEVVLKGKGRPSRVYSVS